MIWTARNYMTRKEENNRMTGDKAKQESNKIRSLRAEQKGANCQRKC